MGYFDETDKLGRSACVWGVIFILGGLFDGGLGLFLLISAFGSTVYVGWIIAGVLAILLAISCWIGAGFGIAAGTKKKVKLARSFFFAVIAMLVLDISTIIAIFATSFVQIWLAYWMIIDFIFVAIVCFQAWRYWHALKNGGGGHNTQTVVVVAAEPTPVVTTTTTVVQQGPPQPVYVQQQPQPMYVQQQQPMYVQQQPPPQQGFAPPPQGGYVPPQGMAPPESQYGQQQPQYYVPQQQAPTY